jgi:two-component system CheB/CheR fusion protein
MRDRLLVLAQAGNMEVGNHLARQMRVLDIAFESSPSAQIVVDGEGTLAMVNELVRTLFGLSQRDVGRPFQDLELSYKPVDLRSLMDRCINERRIVKAENVERSQPDGTTQYLEIQLTPLFENGTLLGASILFNDQTRYYKLQEEIQRHQQELETAYEELETTNEELQSILGSLHTGLVVLDTKQNITSWNHRSEDLWGLRADEVHGQSLVNLDIGLPIQKLKVAIRSCLIGESDPEEAILDAINRRGKAIKCHVTCTPIVSTNQDCQGSILMMDELETA